MIRHAMYICSKGKEWFINILLLHLFVSLPTRPVTPRWHCSLFPLWTPGTRWIGLTRTATLIEMWLSAMEKAGLRALCTLRRPPLSVASCSLKAYGLKWQWGAGDAKAINFLSWTPAGNTAAIKEGREGRKWQVGGVRECFTAHT